MDKQFKINEYIINPEEIKTAVNNGKTAVVYPLGNNKVIKLFKKDFPLSLILQEYSNNKDIYKIGVPCPKTYGLSRLGKQYCIIMESFCGKLTYEQAIAKNFSKCNLLLCKYIKGLRHMHTFDASKTKLANIKNLYLGAAVTISKIYGEKLIYMIQKVLKHIPDRHTFLQTDCHIGNCFANTDKPVFFDFSFAGYGHPILDLFAQYSHLIFWPHFNKIDDLSIEQCKIVFNIFLKEYLKTDNKLILTNAERQLRCICNTVILISPPLAPNLYSKTMIKNAIVDFEKDAEWFIQQQIIE